MRDTFYCKSLNLVAYLKSKNIEPFGFNNRSNKVTFYFEKNDNLQSAIDDYNSNSELKKFIGAFKEVKEFLVSLN